MNDKIRALAIGAACILLSFPQVSVAEEFTGADLLSKSVETQINFIQASVTMAAVMATQHDPEWTKCLNEWYFKDADKRNSFILETIADYKDFHPSGTILATLQKNCGAFSE